MSSNVTIRRAVRLALLAGAGTAGFVGAPAHAQDESASARDLDTVIVTGSRIVRQDFTSVSPVVTVDSDAFELSGEVQIESVLNTMPQLVPSITTTSNNPSNGGQANVNLRGLGTVRTLVLLDGTRVTPSNVNGVTDLNTFPAGLIDSVEILSGGASSTYGSDAVAGVVNVKLKRNFEGVRLNSQYNVTEESDGRTLLVEAIVGGNFAEDRGNAVLAFTYDQRDDVFAGAREFSQVARGAQLQPLGSGTVPDGRIDWGANGPSQAALNTVFGSYGVAPGVVTPTRPIGFNTDGTLFSFGGAAATPVANFRGDTSDPGFNPTSYSYNYAPVNYLQLPLERRQIFAQGYFDPTGTGQAEVYGRMMFTTYNADQELAATPVTCATAATPGCTLPVTNTAIPADLRTLLESRATPGAALTFTKRTVEVGSRFQENNYDVLQSLLGARGNFAVGDDDWNWDVYGSWGQARGTQLQEGNVSRSRLQSALNNPAVFSAQGCATFNPFGNGALSPECARAIAIGTSNVFEFEQINFVGSVTGGLFSLPAGSVRFAVGAEYRQNDADFRPDTFLATGDVVGFNAQQPISGRITVVEPFAELSVPILADLPAANYLGLELGYRYSDYNLSGTANTYKAGLQWNPIESVKVRGGINRSIRAPNIEELFLPTQENFPQYTDPCNFNSTFRTGPNAAQVVALCEAQGIPAAALPTFTQVNSQARAFIGGNINLEPETADGWSVGFTFQSPSESDWLRRFSMSADYFSVEVEDVISSLTASSIIGRCFNQLNGNPTFDPANQFCSLFIRNPANFGITDVVTTSINLSALKAEGVDVNLDYGLPLSVFGASEAAGDLNFRLLWTATLSREQQETAADPFIPREGTISQTVASAFPKHKANLATTYTVGDFLVRYTARYIDGMDVVNNDAVLSPSTGLAPSVGSYVYHDLSGRWNINDSLSATLGVLNVGDKDPPVYTTNSQAGIQANTDPSTYDVLGRRFFINLTAQF
jgi:outer membrane receptor protein involved in Fe transport